MEREVEKLERRRDMMIAAYYSNPTWDEKENREKRENIVREIESKHNEGVAFLRSLGKKELSPVDKEDPAQAELESLYGQARRGLGNVVPVKYAEQEAGAAWMADQYAE